jgi:hypothetical protein
MVNVYPTQSKFDQTLETYAFWRQQNENEKVQYMRVNRK